VVVVASVVLLIVVPLPLAALSWGIVVIKLDGTGVGNSIVCNINLFVTPIDEILSPSLPVLLSSDSPGLDTSISFELES
jgi:hypothetical protein